MKDRLENVENGDTTDDSGSQSDLDLDEIRRKVGGRTTRQIMSQLRIRTMPTLLREICG